MMRSPKVLLVAAVSYLLATGTSVAAGEGSHQAAQAAIVGSVTLHEGVGVIADVEVMVFGPMEGQAKAAIASFPLMAAEISERLGIPHVTTTTGADGRFIVQNLAPGLYSVLAKRKGFVGPARPGDPPTSTLVSSTVTLGSTERVEILLSMVPRENKP